MAETLRRYCLCGASCTVRSTPQALAESLVANFEQLHTREGHGPATAPEASRARRRNEALDGAE